MFLFALIQSWDDDFDITMDRKHIPVVKKKIAKMARNKILSSFFSPDLTHVHVVKGPYQTHRWNDNLFKIFSKKRYSHNSGQRPWTWPFIDVWLQVLK